MSERTLQQRISNLEALVTKLTMIIMGTKYRVKFDKNMRDFDEYFGGDIPK